MSDNNAGQLMNALISKMESMDNDIQAVRAENAMLRKAFDNPQLILRKAGFVPYSTPSLRTCKQTHSEPTWTLPFSRALLTRTSWVSMPTPTRKYMR